MKEPLFNQFKFHSIESKKSCRIKHHASKTRQQLSSFFHKQGIERYHRGKLERDGDLFIEM
jgi:hypothetical protein